MTYKIGIEQAAPRRLAVASAQTTFTDLPATIGRLFGEVYAFIGAGGAKQSGHNIVVYRRCEGETLDIEVGVEIAEEFKAGGKIGLSRTPAGNVARTVHVGPYSGLIEAHRAVRGWCLAHGHAIAGPNWEIYGDWCADQAQLRTEVCYLVEGGSGSGSPP
jgi:effector-binding domain-containing protein